MSAGPGSRVVSVDAFRGYAILNVIFFNDISGAGGIPGWMDHAPEGLNRMTYVDIGVASFLLIVGMSIPLAFRARWQRRESLAATWRHVLLRSAALIVMGSWMVYRSALDPAAVGMPGPVWGLGMYLGFFLLWFGHGTPRLGSWNLDPLLRAAGAALLGYLAWRYHTGMQTKTMCPEWWGILGQIGWGYLLASAAYIHARRWLPWLVLAGVAALPAVYWVINKAPIPAVPFGLTFLLDSVIVLAGVYASQRLFLSPPARERQEQRFGWVAAAIALCWLIGRAYAPLFGVSKADTTPAYIMFGLASGFAVFLFFYLLVDGLKKGRWLGFLDPAARNPLTLYLMGEMSYDVMQALGLRGHPPLFADGVPRLLYAAVFTGLMLLLLTLITRRYPRLGF